jgi:hypothetical protein
MTNDPEENPDKERHDRLTIRIDRDYNNWLDLVVAYLASDKSKFVRNALDEYVERHEHEFHPRHFRWWKEWRERRGRAGI